MTVTNPPSGRDPNRPSWRQQRKAATRARIATTAMNLFLERGFEHVSVIEIAAVVGVTEKTVFNHFATKEELVFPQDHDTEVALLDALRSRPAGTSAISALRSFFLAGYARRFPREIGPRRRAAKIAELVGGSPALRARERAILARYADLIGDRLAAETEAGPGELRPAVVANAVIAVHQAVLAGYRAGLPGRESTAALSRRMQQAAAEAFDLLAAGLGGYAAGDRRDSAGPGTASTKRPHGPHPEG